jgi:hypothetical protein
MWRKLALGTVAVLAILVAVIALQPSSFSVERGAAIQAPPDVVYRHVQSLRAMDEWSPFARMDPEMQIRYEGPESGVGAQSSFEGPQMGKGSLTITAVKPDREVEMQLEMLEPMQASNHIRFTFEPTGEATRVTWRMDGTSGFVAKAIGLVVDMDEMVGSNFETGLAQLKLAAEADAAGRPAEQARGGSGA